MLIVESLIGDLLIQHNCVVVPSFGGFVAQRVAAQIDTTKGILSPARKSVLFNRQLINNDGLLIAAIAQNQHISFPEAQSILTTTVEAWDGQLKNGERVAIDRVGILFLDRERNLCFEQDRFYNLLLESFGLGAIHFVSAADVAAKEAHSTIQTLVKQMPDESVVSPIIQLSNDPIVPVFVATNEENVIPITATKKPNKVIRYVAAACMLPIAFYSFWIPVKTDVLESGMITLSDFNPFRTSESAQYKPAVASYNSAQKEVKPQLETVPEGVETFSYELDEDTYVPVRVKESSSVQTTASIDIPVTSNNGNGTNNSHIIVGSFAARENAENLVAQLKTKGYNAQILEANGTIRVSAGKGADYFQLSPKLKAEGLAPWLLK